MRPKGIPVNHTLKDTRLKRRHTQSDLAEILGVTLRHIQRMENGEPVSLKAVKKVARYLGQTTDETTRQDRNDVWFVKSRSTLGRLESSINLFREEFTKTIEHHYVGGVAQCDLDLELSDEPELKTVSLLINGNVEQKWDLRPAVITDRGIGFKQLKGLDKIFWKEDLESLKYCYVDNAKYKGERVVGADVLRFFRVTFLADLTRNIVGHTDFSEDLSFRDSLTDWIEEAIASGMRVRAFPSDSFDSVRIEKTGNFFSCGCETLLIERKASFIDGIPSRAPWSKFHIEALCAAINDNQPLPFCGIACSMTPPMRP